LYRKLLTHQPFFDHAAALKLTTIGNSFGAVLPKEILTKLRVDKGDTLYVVETPEGMQKITR
jgi:putative addiction module antidote